MYVWREKEGGSESLIYFKALAHMIVGAGNSEGQAGDSGIVDDAEFLLPKRSVFSLKVFS